ncbi:PAn-2 domain-containing protein [Fusarium circinatum]|uniref:PAn-2 domain-containing protein n=1 Tax=Fusarium circinatum TaxID=48490 RepID=A0A8H5SP78_FUSCI|nr:PAn-2 domain-containing protein [Fusarium circinatum]
MKNPIILTAIFLLGLPLTLAAPPQCGIPGDGSTSYRTTNLRSASECIHTCESEARCLSSEFRPSNGNCWLYDKPVAQAKTREDTTGTYVFNDKGCPWLQCGLSADGSDFHDTKIVRSTAECQAACKDDTACRSSEFRYDNGKCWLYKKPVFAAKTKDKDGTHVFYDRDCPPLQCWVAGDGTAYYTMKTFGSAKDCLHACKEDIRCLSVEYGKPSGKCWFYDQTVAVARTKDARDDWIFFDKDCSLEA